MAGEGWVPAHQQVYELLGASILLRIQDLCGKQVRARSLPGGQREQGAASLPEPGLLHEQVSSM